MSQIAREAGIALILYLYFDSKESLFNFLLKYIFTNEQDLEAISVPIRSSSWNFEIISARNAFVSSKLSALFDDAIRRGDVKVRG